MQQGWEQRRSCSQRQNHSAGVVHSARGTYSARVVDQRQSTALELYNSAGVVPNLGASGRMHGVTGGSFAPLRRCISASGRMHDVTGGSFAPLWRCISASGRRKLCMVRIHYPRRGKLFTSKQSKEVVLGIKILSIPAISIQQKFYFRTPCNEAYH